MPSIVLLQRDHEASPHLRALIDATEQFWVAGTAHTVEEARVLLKNVQPDILVTDLKVQDGLVDELLIELRQSSSGRMPRPHVLVTMMSQDDTLLMQALRSGADGYWIHSESHEVLITLLEQLARGESPISPTIARQVLSHFRAPAKPVSDTMTEALNPLVLTGTEQAILQWVAQGYLIDEIAQQWQASVHSLACGIRRVYHKLQFDLRATSLSLQAA
jgi:DNA-binding NarL/FixJ family response regulator